MGWGASVGATTRCRFSLEVRIFPQNFLQFSLNKKWPETARNRQHCLGVICGSLQFECSSATMGTQYCQPMYSKLWAIVWRIRSTQKFHSKMTPHGLYTQFHLTEITYAKVCISEQVCWFCQEEHEEFIHLACECPALARVCLDACRVSAMGTGKDTIMVNCWGQRHTMMSIHGLKHHLSSLFHNNWVCILPGLPRLHVGFRLYTSGSLVSRCTIAIIPMWVRPWNPTYYLITPMSLGTSHRTPHPLVESV